jgi:molybdopterin molybdotransferase
MKIPATLGNSITHTTGRTEYQRGQFKFDGNGYTVSHTGEQGSNRLSSFRHANCLIEIDKAQGDMHIGDPVLILPLTNLLH